MSRTKAFFNQVHEIATKKVKLLILLDSSSSQREFLDALSGLERIDDEISKLAEQFGFPDDELERRPEDIKKIVDAEVHKELSKLDKKKQEEIKTSYNNINRSRSPPGMLCGGLPTTTTDLQQQQIKTTFMSQQQQQQACNNMSHSPPGLCGLPATDLQNMHKNQLQIYAQKRKMHLPIFSWKSEGPSHNPRFKCMVTVAGQNFQSPEFYRSLKEAEQAASAVALASLTRAGIPEGESAGFSKNFLQEFLLKEGHPFPTYMTKSHGPPHLPTFLCTVEVGGAVFEGTPARTKKQAEMNAAKVAYLHLKECKLSRSMICQNKDPPQCTSSNNSISSWNLDLPQNVKSEDRFVFTSPGELKKELKGSYEDANVTKPVLDEGIFRSTHPSVASSVKPVVNEGKFSSARPSVACSIKPVVDEGRFMSSTRPSVASSTKPVVNGENFCGTRPSVASSVKPVVDEGKFRTTHPSVASSVKPVINEGRFGITRPSVASSTKPVVDGVKFSGNHPSVASPIKPVVVKGKFSSAHPSVASPVKPVVVKGKFSSPHPSVASSLKPVVNKGKFSSTRPSNASAFKPVVGRGKFSGTHPSGASSVKPCINSTMRNKVPGVIDARPQDPSLSSTDVCVVCSLSPYHKSRCPRHHPAPEEDLSIKREVKRAKTGAGART